MYTPMTIEEEVARLAQQFVDKLKSVTGIDYTPHMDQIKSDIDEYVLNGNWDHTIEIDDPNLKNIRVIEENEYDQSMDEDEKPSWDDVIDVRGYYLILEN